MPECVVRMQGKWLRLGDAFATGQAFKGYTYYSTKDLAQVFAAVESWDDFRQMARQLNGFFAVVVKRGSRCYVAADRVRSQPVFYAINGDTFYISDDPEWIQGELNAKEYCPVSLVEYFLAGYVTGTNTLDRRIKQVQAGEVLAIDFSEGVPRLHQERYYEFIPNTVANESLTEKDLLSTLDEVVRNVTHRLINLANGRPIVVPLSGGLDSRLIVMALKRFGYKNIVAFSYGVRNNWEARLSKEVADYLAIPWHFVEYNKEKWRQWYWSEKNIAYMRFGSRLVSLAHLQDWPAVLTLVRAGVIREDAIVVPGHSADFVAGSHIPPELLSHRGYTGEDVLQAIWRHHYSLMPLRVAARQADLDDAHAMQGIWERLETVASLGREAFVPALTALGLYERWDWQERQAKYIVNSVRVYDFFGLEWWLPWWDGEFVEFWENVPVRYRINRWLYRVYVRGFGLKIGVRVREPLPTRVRAMLRGIDKAGLLRRIYSFVRGSRSAPASSILALDGAWEGTNANLKGLTGPEVHVLGIASLMQHMLLEAKGTK